jgi:hypothetical protein
MANTLIPGLIGISLVLMFLGVILWWVKAIPLIIIVIGVVAMMIYDFLQTLRFGEDHGRS